MIFFRQNIFLLLTLITLNIFLSENSFAQDNSKYKFKPALDIPMLSVGVAGTVSSLILRSHNDPFDILEVNELDAQSIPGLDRQAIEKFSPASQRASDILLSTSYALPLASLLIPEVRQELGIISIMLAESILINETLTGITKNLVNRPRPYTYNPDLDDAIRTDAGNNLSFFSGHTSYTAMFSFFTARVLHDYLENTTTRVFVWAGAALLPAATGYFRYAGGKHFITDVVAGYLVGAAVGYFIPKLHETDDAKNNKSGFHLDRESSHPFSLVFVF